MDRYEHMSLNILPTMRVVDELNRYGADGWKIVASHYLNGWEFILGRKLRFPEPSCLCGSGQGEICPLHESMPF